MQTPIIPNPEVISGETTYLSVDSEAPVLGSVRYAATFSSVQNLLKQKNSARIF